MMAGSHMLQQVGSGGALHSMLGWHHGGACAWWVGSLGVLGSVLRWCHGRACASWVGIVVALHAMLG